jgi:hypothetical protein
MLSIATGEVNVPDSLWHTDIECIFEETMQFEQPAIRVG